MTRTEATARLLAHWCAIQIDEEHFDTFPHGYTPGDWQALFTDHERELWRGRATALLNVITLLGDD